ncbi:MAG: CoA transferase [Acetobacteraceae bacterium]|nr:CoA transferase [Acetobacteraceae bacterium]
MAIRTEVAPLDGITVLDFGQVFQGPYASMLLARAGANVIKIEPPGIGEPLRRRATAAGGTSLSIAMMNSNKRAITLNLKAAAGRELLFAMARKADVLLENFAPGVMDRLGVGFAALHEINPRLVYATGTGFGISGPDANNLAMDLTIQGASGIMSVTGFPDGPPTKAGPTLVDIMGGTALYGGIVTALYERDRTGFGRLVEVAMQETVYAAMAASIDYYHRTGALPPRPGNRQSGRSTAPYNVYPARDGHVALMTVTEEHWPNLCRAMGRDDLANDPRFASNAARMDNVDETDALVAAWTSTLNRAEIFAITRQYRIPCAPVRTIPEVMNDPHMHGRGMLEWIDHPALGRVVVPNSPIRLHGAERSPTQPSPALGQHNHDVYGGWLGLSAAEISRLQESGVI